MFDCQRTREFIDLYLDNELESVPTKHVAEHLERCAECRREFELMRSQNELLASSIKKQQYDTTKLSAEIEAATIGKAAFRLPELLLPRMPVWVLGLGCILMVALSVVFYFPGRMSTALAHPFYRAAAADHRACFADSAASDWIRSQPGINELATSFLNEKQNVPASIVGEYRLVRARICKFDGVRFLHVIYETADRRHVSLFIGRRAASVPSGEQSETVNGRDLQLAHVSGLSVFCAEDGNRLLFAASPDENIARSALLRILDSQ
jgi:anti-sigma factor RsiW